MKIAVSISRILVGVLFIISGFVKLIDPLGFSYKLNEYFAPQVLDLTFLIPFSLLLSIFVVVFEVVLGVFLLIGYKVKFTVWNLLLMILFFTFLTYYAAEFEKVKDCGCFGDAVKLSPWGTFWKDIALLVLILILFIWNKEIKPIIAEKFLKLTAFSSVFIGFGIVYYVLIHLPIIDFRPYKIGVNIEEGMAIPLDAPKSVYDDVWYYRVDGKVNEYSTDDAPWEITGAEFVDRVTTETVKGYTPPIHDFTIEKDGADYTDDVLQTEKVLLIVLYNLDKSENNGITHLEKLHQDALKKGYLVIGLTASLEDSITKIKKDHNLTFDFYACDETALKTIIRSNPGILTLNNGTITQKVNWNDIDNLEL